MTVGRGNRWRCAGRPRSREAGWWDDFITLADLAPTFVEAAGLKPPTRMTGRSFLGLLTGKEKPGRRDRVFVERERHANVRQGDLSYPSRAARTREYLYIRNFRPDRWPAGDPQTYFAVGPYGDCDGSPTKELILKRRDEPAMKTPFRALFRQTTGRGIVRSEERSRQRGQRRGPAGVRRRPR